MKNIAAWTAKICTVILLGVLVQAIGEAVGGPASHTIVVFDFVNYTIGNWILFTIWWVFVLSFAIWLAHYEWFT